MKSLLFIITALLFGHFSCLAQMQKTDTSAGYFNKLFQIVQEAYGIDQVLVHGIFYEDIYPNKIGHPFLYDDEFFEGTIVFKGKEYTGIDLKYDLFEQKLVLYMNHNNSVIWFIPPNDFISSFTLNRKNFAKFDYQGESRFYQVIFNTEKLKCLYYWSKSKFDADHSGTFNKVEFKYNQKRKYLVLEGKFLKYQNNTSFTKLFPKEIKSGIKNYMESHKIKVAKSNDETITELLTYCSSLLQH